MLFLCVKKSTLMIYCNCSFFRACGTVYIARDNETDEVVAIKIVSLQQDQKQLGLIVKEIEALTTLEHKNIINYRGSYRINQTLWIVMDYLEGMILQSNRGNWTQLKLANAVWVYIYLYISQLKFTGAGSCCFGHKERVITTTSARRTSNERVSIIGFSVG